VVSRPRKFEKGSKRRIRQLRWTRYEIVSAAFLLFAMAFFIIFVALWMASHHFD
jgi:hypothetical protein